MRLTRSASARALRSLSSSRSLLGGDAARLLVDARVVDRDRRLRGDADDDPLGALVEHAGLEWPKKSAPMVSPLRSFTGTAR